MEGEKKQKARRENSPLSQLQHITAFECCEKAACKHFWAFVWLSIKATSSGVQGWGEQPLKWGWGPNSENGSIGPGIRLRGGLQGGRGGDHMRLTEGKKKIKDFYEGSFFLSKKERN